MDSRCIFIWFSTILITFWAFKRITTVVAYDKVYTLSDYVFGPEINLLIKFPQKEILWSPFENKASVATKKSCWSQKKKNRLRILMFIKEGFKSKMAVSL